MASVNRTIHIGNTTRDPELRRTPNGTLTCEIGLAVNRKFKLESGETREEVLFLEITFWGKQAEIVCQYAKKGDALYIAGRLSMDEWVDKVTGAKRTKMRITAEEFQFLSGRSGS